MGFGRLTLRQKVTLSIHVKGQIVHDLGAGDLELARLMLTLGAKRVHAVDKAEIGPSQLRQKALSFKRGYFHDLPKTPMDVLFTSWPINHDSGIVPHVERAGKVIYLGCNTGGSMCGTPELFAAMVRRELLAYVPDRHNSLVVVGKPLEGPRAPTGEELAGLNITSEYYSFENAEAEAS